MVADSGRECIVLRNQGEGGMVKGEGARARSTGFRIQDSVLGTKDYDLGAFSSCMKALNLLNLFLVYLLNS
jgi:hypothetical protein